MCRANRFHTGRRTNVAAISPSSMRQAGCPLPRCPGRTQDSGPRTHANGKRDVRVVSAHPRASCAPERRLTPCLWFEKRDPLAWEIRTTPSGRLRLRYLHISFDKLPIFPCEDGQGSFDTTDGGCFSVTAVLRLLPETSRLLDIHAQVRHGEGVCASWPVPDRRVHARLAARKTYT